MNEDDRQQLFDYAALGREIDSFWSSRIGEYLLKRSDDEYVEAMNGLKTADASNVNTILALQSKALRAETFRGWLSDAIKTGLVAEAQLDDRDDDGQD